MKRAMIGRCLVLLLCLTLSSTKPSQIAAASPAIDNSDPNIFLHGYCVVQEPGGHLTGACAVPIFLQGCRVAQDLRQCPAGAYRKILGQVACCHKTCGFFPVDKGRPCTIQLPAGSERLP